MDGGGGHKSGGFVPFMIHSFTFSTENVTFSEADLSHPLPLSLSPQAHLQTQPRHDQIPDD